MSLTLNIILTIFIYLFIYTHLSWLLLPFVIISSLATTNNEQLMTELLLYDCVFVIVDHLQHSQPN